MAVLVPRRAECLAAIRARLEAGSDVNVRDAGGRTPLHWAAALNTNVAAMKAALAALVAAGADVRAKDNNGSEPLHFATCNQDAEAAAATIAALVAAGAGCAGQGQGWDGATPCHSLQP